jgi:hypothetical protein
MPKEHGHYFASLLWHKPYPTLTPTTSRRSTTTPPMEFRKVGWGDPALVLDEEKDLFRFTGGRFAFSREHADWALLEKRGRLKGL